MMHICPICNNDGSTEHNGYMRCLRCGHEVIAKDLHDVFIVNEELDATKVKKRDMLDRFRASVIDKTALNHDYLVDVGSASGKFLYQNRSVFKKCIGVEVTKVCVDFSRNILGLDIVERIDAIPQRPISIMSFWHSLEHIDLDIIKNIFNSVQPLVKKEARVIISVPNSNALLYRMFGSHYAYFDDASHIHQFSSDSLDLLMGQCGYQKARGFSSLVYASFGSLQTILNVVNKRHNFLYYYLKRGNTFGLSKNNLYLWVIYNILLTPFALLLTFLFVPVDLIAKRWGSVLTTCYTINQQ